METKDELADEPLVSVFSSKGKEKVISDDDSEEDQEDTDTKLEATVARVTQTAVEKKNLPDIIFEITAKEEAATAKSTSFVTQQTSTKSPGKTHKVSSKRKGAQTSGGATVLEEPEHKRTKPT